MQNNAKMLIEGKLVTQDMKLQKKKNGNRLVDTTTLPFLKSLLSQLLMRACLVYSEWLDLNGKVKLLLFFPFVYCSFKMQQCTVYHPLICCACLNRYVSHL